MISQYNEEDKGAWDTFVLEDSINGNFLQTRNFLNYHADGKYEDGSIVVRHGEKIAAVIPANLVDGGRTLLAHQGSTFGGLVVGRDFANTKSYNWIFEELMSYFVKRGYERVELRMHHWLYSPDEKRNELLDYYFQLNGFSEMKEVGFYFDLAGLEEDYRKNFTRVKRKNLNKAAREGLEFRRLHTDDEVREFHAILSDNMKKFGKTPVHTVEDILDFKNNRLKDVTSFYGVYSGDKMISGSMMWNFCDKKVLHAQYIMSLQDYLDVRPNDFMYVSLIEEAKRENYRYLSYGTTTLEHGEVYNENLGLFKEGFNTDTYTNSSYIWEK